MKFLALAGLIASASASVSWSQLQYQESQESNTVSSADFEWFSQRLDHFNGLNSQKLFKQKFFSRDFTRGKPNRPMFIYIGGEAPLGAGAVSSGMVPQMAQQFEAQLYALEHRFYGDSFPSKNKIMNDSTLGFHNTNQALADLVHFIDSKKAYPDQPVIVFGCSYPGSLAAYLRTQYPHLVTGAISSSSPVIAHSDYKEYDNIIVEAVNQQRPGCLRHIQRSYQAADRALLGTSDEVARAYLRDVGCNDFHLESEQDRASALYVLADNVAFAVQYNKMGNFINNMCDSLEDPTVAEEELTDELEAKGDFGQLDSIYRTRTNKFMRAMGRYTGSCEDQRMTSFTVDKALSDPQAMQSRAWLFQCCSNYGYWQTAPQKPEASSRSSAIDLDFHMQLCDKLFPLARDEKWSDEAPHANTLFGDRRATLNRLLAATNIHFTNGDADPWKVLSVLPEHINASQASQSTLTARGVTSHVIPEGSHCNDFGTPFTPQQKDAYKAIFTQVSKYLEGSTVTSIQEIRM